MCVRPLNGNTCTCCRKCRNTAFVLVKNCNGIPRSVMSVTRAANCGGCYCASMETTGCYLTVIYSHATVSHKGQKATKKNPQFSHGHSCCPLMAVWEVTLHRVKVPASVCSHCCCLVASLNDSPFIPQDDFLLIHYDKGPCRNKLGHSRASVIWHRTQVRNRPPSPLLLLLVSSSMRTHTCTPPGHSATHSLALSGWHNGARRALCPWPSSSLAGSQQKARFT